MGTAGPLHPTDAGTILDVWAVPGAARTEIRGLHDGALRVRVAALASGGEANRALLVFLRKRVGCPVRIHRGAGGRRKQILIESSDLEALATILGIGNR